MSYLIPSKHEGYAADGRRSLNDSGGGGGGGAPDPNTTQTKLTDPARLPYLTKLWDQVLPMYEAKKIPTANPFSAGDMSAVWGPNAGPVSTWTDRNGKDMTVKSTGPIDWSK